MTKDEAIQMGESGWWKTKTAREIVQFQLNERLLCMPFGEFHKAVGEALGRSVWTHEFGNYGTLLDEFNGQEPTPENPAQHALDSLAAMMLASGDDPDEKIIIVGRQEEIYND